MGQKINSGMLPEITVNPFMIPQDSCKKTKNNI